MSLWLFFGYLITTAANAAVVFKDGIGDALIGNNITVMRYNANGELDYRIEARQELRSLKIKQLDLLNVEAARLRRVQYKDGLFFKGPLRLTFATAQSGIGQLKLSNVQGELNGQPFKAREVNYRIGEKEFAFTHIRYFQKNGFKQKQNVRYLLLNDGSLDEIAPSIGNRNL